MNMKVKITDFFLFCCQNHRKIFFIIFVFSVTASILDTLSPYWIKRLIDDVVSKKNSANDAIAQAFFIVACIWLIKEILHRSVTFLCMKTFPQFRSKLQIFLAKSLLEKNYNFYLKRNTGTIYARLSLISTTTENIISSFLLSYVSLLATLTMTFFLLLSLNIVFVFLSAAWLIYHCSITFLFLRKGKQYSRFQATANAKFLGKLTDSIRNFLAAVCFRNNHLLIKHLKENRERCALIEIKTGWHYEKLRIYGSIGAITLLLLTLTELWQMSHSPTFAVGDIPMTLMLVGGMLSAFWNVVTQVSSLTNNYHQLCDALSDLEISTVKPRTETPSTLAVDFSTLVFNNISFYYQKHASVIRNFNLRICANEKILIKAQNGRGKSTLLSLLSGLLTPLDGNITLDGIDLNVSDSSQLTNLSLVLFAKPILLQRTVLDNLRMVAPHSTINEINQAIEDADCGFIEKLPMGIHTILQENGENFSQGQRQRLNLARAFLSSRKIIMLDEPFSHIDTVSRNKIQTNIFQKLSKKTLIIADYQHYEPKYFNQIIQL
jgi:ATP-binding cassette subfamily B protein